jgi:hypothetical protein
MILQFILFFNYCITFVEYEVFLEQITVTIFFKNLQYLWLLNNLCVFNWNTLLIFHQLACYSQVKFYIVVH